MARTETKSTAAPDADPSLTDNVGSGTADHGENNAPDPFVPAVDEPEVSDVPPPGVIIRGGDEVVQVTAEPTRQDIVSAFVDEHVGKGGTYEIDGETGERKAVWERYDDNGKTKYRPVV